MSRAWVSAPPHVSTYTYINIQYKYVNRLIKRTFRWTDSMDENAQETWRHNNHTGRDKLWSTISLSFVVFRYINNNSIIFMYFLLSISIRRIKAFVSFRFWLPLFSIRLSRNIRFADITPIFFPYLLFSSKLKLFIQFILASIWRVRGD